MKQSQAHGVPPLCSLLKTRLWFALSECANYYHFNTITKTETAACFFTHQKVMHPLLLTGFWKTSLESFETQIYTFKCLRVMQMDLNWKNVSSLELGSPAGNLTQKMYRATASYFAPGICKWVTPHGRTLGCHEWKRTSERPARLWDSVFSLFLLENRSCGCIRW